MPFSMLNGSGIDGEAAHPLERREVALARRTASPTAPRKSVFSASAARSGLTAAAAREALGEVGVGHDQRDQMRPAVAVDHRLGDLGLQQQQALDALRREVVAAGVDDDVLLAVGDLEIAVGVEHADIAGVQPAVA